MKILFTILSIESDDKMYLTSTKNLTKEILNQTNHDVLISTNNVNFFNSIKNERVIVRDNIAKDSIFKYNSEFNYNLKHFAFENLPEGYDCLIYLDCDIKLEGWNNDSEVCITNLINNHDFGATRLNCYLGRSITELKETGTTLFRHKIDSYKIREKYSEFDDIMNSQLPSEHFLIFKYDTEKLKKFQEKWKEMNDYLQSINGDGGSWGDGFEIGISARYAGYHNTTEISHDIWDGIFGFKFNGNKYNEIIDINELNLNNLTEPANKFLDIVAVTYSQNESLKCFINSIKSQTNPNWRLFIVHDGINNSLKNDLNENGYLGDNVIFVEYPERTENYGHYLRGWAINNLIDNEYVLLTNGDNYYTPNMVNEVLDRDEDFIYFDCVHSHSTEFNHNKTSYGHMDCNLLANQIDMGCVVVKTEISKNVGFTTNVYSADWNYFNNILSLNPSITKINKILFVHN